MALAPAPKNEILSVGYGVSLQMIGLQPTLIEMIPDPIPPIEDAIVTIGWETTDGDKGQIVFNEPVTVTVKVN